MAIGIIRLFHFFSRYQRNKNIFSTHQNCISNHLFWYIQSRSFHVLCTAHFFAVHNLIMPRQRAIILTT